MRIARKPVAAPAHTVAAVNLAFLVTACLLIAFVLSADKGIEITSAITETGAGVATGGAPVTVRVQTDGSFVVDGKPLAVDRFAEYLKAAVDRGGAPAAVSRPVLVVADGDAPYGALVEVLDELRQVRGTLRLGSELHVTVVGAAGAGPSGSE